MPQKVLHLSPWLWRGGLESYLETLSRNLSSFGWESGLFVGYGNPALFDELFPHIPPQWRRYADQKFALTPFVSPSSVLVEMIQEFAPSVGTVHLSNDLVVLAEKEGLPLVAVSHGNGVFQPKDTAARNCAATVFVSPSLAYEGQAQCRHKLVIENAAAEYFFDPWPKDTQVRDTINVPHRAYCIGWVGRPTENKGVWHFLDIVREAPRLWYFVVIGEDVSNPHLMKLWDFNARQFSNLRWIPRVAHRNLPKVMSTFDAVLHTAPHEGFGLVLAEAAALGIPVVARLATGTRDVVVPGASGFLINQLNPKAYVDALEYVMRHREHFTERCKAVARFRWHPSRQAYAYDRVLYRASKCNTEMLYDVCIIVVTWDHPSEEKLIDRIMQSMRQLKRCSLVWVDQGNSLKATTKECLARLPRTKIISLDQPIGDGPAINRALDTDLARLASYVVCLAHNSLPFPNAIPILVEKMQSLPWNVGALGFPAAITVCDAPPISPNVSCSDSPDLLRAPIECGIFKQEVFESGVRFIEEGAFALPGWGGLDNDLYQSLKSKGFCIYWMSTVGCFVPKPKARSFLGEEAFRQRWRQRMELLEQRWNVSFSEQECFD